MKTSIIRQRVADFFQRHAPFDVLSEADLLTLAGSGKVKFHESEEYLYRKGDAPGPFVWVIQQGRVELLDETDAGERLRDLLGEGDVLGLERFAGDGACLCAARTATDVILYGVAADEFGSIVVRYPAVQRFLAAHRSVSGVLGFNRTSWLEAEAPPLEYLRARLPTIGTSVVAHAPAVWQPYSTRTAVQAMLSGRAEAVTVTTEGSPAILTGAELAMFCGYDAAGMVSAIRRSASIAEIRPLLRRAKQMVVDALAQPRDVDDCCRISAELVAATADACIRMAEQNVEALGVPRAAAPYCVVMFGTSARGDVLGPGLPTIATVYDDTCEAMPSQARVYFPILAGEIATQMHASGVEGTALEWPDGAQPSMPLSEWKRLYSETILNPLAYNLFGRREFFDLWQLAGDVSILEKLRDHVLLELGENRTAVALLANDTMEHVPPLTFFHGLVLGLDGAQRESFDIGEAVIAPLTDAARVFALAKRRLVPAGTLKRFEMAAEEFPEGASAIREAAEAFRIGLYYQAMAGGARIAPSELGKFDQLLLKTAFSSIQRFIEFTLATFVEPAE